jgi:hypothetical protein
MHCIVLYCTFLQFIVSWLPAASQGRGGGSLRTRGGRDRYCVVLYCVLKYTLLYCSVLYCTVLYSTVLYCIVLYCTVLDCILLYCTTLLYYTILPGEVIRTNVVLVISKNTWTVMKKVRMNLTRGQEVAETGTVL